MQRHDCSIHWQMPSTQMRASIRVSISSFRANPMIHVHRSVVSDSTSRKSSMLDDGYVLLASEESNGVTIDWWSQTGGDSNSTAKRSLEEIRTPKKSKRVALDIQGRKCATACAFQTDVPKADPADCPGAYNELYGRVGVFTLPPSEINHLYYFDL